ncbi:MAG: SDR family oxidoreductase, partial [Bacteroidetes bacterium]|nr:SDR family oxidoreductase [Bacteroidota bacterium]
MSNNLLAGKKGIIFGALDERSISWAVAEKCHEQGAQFTLTNAPIALRMGTLNQLAEKCGAEIIGADATNMDDLKALVEQSMEKLGGKLDFVLHSIGMSPNVRKKKHYTDLNYDWFQKTMDISAMSFHRVLQKYYQMDAMYDVVSVLTLI